MRVGEFGHRSDVARRNFRGRFLRFAARRNQLADTLIGPGLYVEDMRIWLERSAVDAECGDGAHLCSRCFKDEHRQVIAEGLRIFRHGTGCIGQIVYDGIEQGLDADIFAACAT